MSFDRIRSDLRGMDERLAGGGKITAAELFNMIRDLCEDVRTETGVPVEKNPAGDTAQLLQQLPWMGRLVSRQFRTIEDQVVDKRRQEELSDKMRELDRLAEQLELQAGETAVLEDKRRALRSRYAALEAGAAKKLELQRECGELEQQVKIASEVTVAGLQTTLEELRLQQNQAQALAQQLRQEIDQTRQACDEAQRQRLDMSRELEELAGRREVLARGREQKAAELEQLRQLMSQLDGECAKLQQQLDQLQQNLEQKDREQTKERLREAIAQTEQGLLEYDQLQADIARQQTLQQEQAQKNQDAVERQQQLKWQAEQELLQASERIAALQKSIDAGKARKEALAAEEETLKEQNRQTEEWLASLELKQYLDRLERMRQRNQLLMEIRTNLTQDLERLRAVKGMDAKEPTPAVLQASFRDTEKWITHYQQLLNDTVHLLSNVE